MFTLSTTDGDDGPAGQVTYKMEEEGNLENGNAVFSVGCKFILLQLFGRTNWSNRCAFKKTQLPELRTTDTQRKLARNLYVLASCNSFTLQPFIIDSTYTTRNAQVAASLLSPSRYQDAFASLAPA